MDNQSDNKVTIEPMAGAAPRSAMAYLTWLVMALIIIVGGLLGWSLLQPPPVPRTSAERDLARFEELIREKPRDPAAQAGMGAAFLRVGSYERAIEHLNIAVKLEPDPRYRVALVEAYVGQGDTKAAINTVRTAQKANPRFERVWYAEAKIYYDRGEYAKAIGPFHRSLELEPGASDVRYLLGFSQEKLGKHKAAIEQYREALRFMPDYEEALAGLARLDRKSVV